MVTTSPAIVGDTIADRELGQIDFTHSSFNLADGGSLFGSFSQTFLSGPENAAVDSQGHLYVPDAINNRVLAWASAASFTNGQKADLVIGQPDEFSTTCGNGTTRLCFPDAVAIDSADNLYVADSTRVAFFPAPFAQVGPVTSTFQIASSFPTGVAVDASLSIYIAEGQNSRVLAYNQPGSPPTNTFANLVFGQGGSFATKTCNKGGITADSLCGAEAVAVNPSTHAVYIADLANNRVLEYDEASSPPTNTTANRVFGQAGSFTTGTANNGGISANSLNNPTGVWLDSNQNLYVADGKNNRVLEYNHPEALDTTADLVLGQLGSFITNGCDIGTAAGDIAGVGFDSLCLPTGGVADASNNVYVRDDGNRRLLKFVESTNPPNNRIATRELGQQDQFHNGIDRTDNVGLAGPTDVAVDQRAGKTHLWVADSSNNRVLGYLDATSFANAAPAAKLIGQRDTASNFCNGPNNMVAGNTLCAGNVRLGVAVDPVGDLWVADGGNGRVIEFDDPFVFVAGPNGFIAKNVVGKADLHTTGCSTTQSGLCAPGALTFDPAGNLYVAESFSNRVLEYNAADLASAGPAAHLVFGQGGIFTTSTCNKGGRTASSLCGPRGVASDGAGNIYIADGNNHRVLEYNTPLDANSGETGAGDTVADFVIGQPDFVSAPACGTPSAITLCLPIGLAFDRFGGLFVADFSVNRVLGYHEGTHNPSNATAQIVFGVDSFDVSPFGCTFGGGDPPSASNLCAPEGVAVDPAGNLYVANLGTGATTEPRVVAFDGGFIGAPTITATPTMSPTPTPTTTPTPTPTATPTPTLPGKIAVKPHSESLSTTAGASTTKGLVITNKGKGPLHGNVGSPAGPQFTLQAGGGVFDLAPLATRNVTVKFSSAVAGKFIDSMSVTSNDAKHPSVTIKLKGTAK
ncbi:MAG TPA: NHL repeat-containing protein [Candidatus Acidoferrales bacterium]|nr:NHL repeat-containing protein [Candidatus Acidoferrales bacterium]